MTVHQELLQEALNDREEYFDNRSDKWLDSVKASDYEDRTYLLQCAVDSLEDSIEELESFINA